MKLKRNWIPWILSLGFMLGIFCAGTAKNILVRKTNRHPAEFSCKHQDALLSFSRTGDTAVLRFHQADNSPDQFIWSQCSGMTAWRVGNTAYLDINSDGIADVRMDMQGKSLRCFILADSAWKACTEIRDKEDFARDAEGRVFRWQNGAWQPDTSAGGCK